MSVAREFRTSSLMGLGISALRQTLRLGLPMRLLVRLVDSQRDFLLSNTVPGHERSSANRGTSTLKCTISRGCCWKSDRPHFRRILRSTKQTMNTSRSAQPGNFSRARLRSLKRLAASARRGAKGPPTDAEYVMRGSVCLPSAKPAPMLSVRMFALPSVPPTNPWNVYCRASC